MPPELYQRLQQTLMACDEFKADSQLRAIFIDSRIAPWQARLPAASTLADRVNQTIHYLWLKKRAGTGENGLVLLLRVLANQHPPEDSVHHDLLALAEAAAGQAAASDQPSRSSTDPAQADSTVGHIFISHSSQDKRYVRQLAVALQQRGFTPWINEQDIQPGQTWVAMIHENLVACAAMIVIMTPAAEQSKWVNREILEAEELGKPLFPLLLRGRRFFRLSDLQFDTVTDGLLPTERFYDRLRQTLGLPTSSSPVESQAEEKKGFFWDRLRQAIGQPVFNASSVRSIEKKAVISPSSDEPNLGEQQAVPSPKMRLEFDWVPIPAGSFWMGSPEGHSDEKPWHEVYLPEYQIARVPVTNEQWAVFLQETDYEWGGRDRLWTDGLPRGKERHPVVYVSWYDVRAFCEWAGVCLPTEAEWEKAALSTDEQIYPWGNQSPTVSLANFGNKVGNTTPVGQYPQGASPYGLLDMAGNVWEWTSSLYKDYPYKAGDGREEVSGSKRRVLRGGAFGSDTDYLRSAYRLRFDPNYRLDNWGFRVVCVPI